MKQRPLSPASSNYPTKRMSSLELRRSEHSDNAMSDGHTTVDGHNDNSNNTGHRVRRASTSEAPTLISDSPQDNGNKQQQQEDSPPILDITKVNNAMIILSDRARQSQATCRDTIKFFRKRATIEKEYARNLQRIEISSIESLEKAGGRLDSFVTQWQKALEIHGGIGSSRYDMGEALNHMANDFTSFCEEKERVLKQIREINSQNLREVEDAVIAMERTKQKYEAQCRDWERLLLKKNGRIDLANQLSKSRHIGGTVSGIFHKHKNLTPEMLEQLEKEARVKVKICNENYKLQLTNTNRIRSSYYGEELPNSIQKMYDLVLEIDEELKTRLRRYVYMYESCMLSDALLIKPTDQPGMSDLVEYIDNQGDLDAFVRAMSKSQESPTRTNIPYLEYEMSPVARSFANPKPIFGVPLEKQVARDNKRIPVILTKCINVIEVCGLQQEGLYRLSGQLSVINKLQADFDIDADKVDLQASVYKDDVNNLTGLVKQYLRKLPDGLISSTQCIKLAHIINSAGGKADNAISAFKTELESMAEHNYHVLAYLIHHFEKVQAFQEYNMMNSANLSIVLGPTIVGADGLSNPADQFKTQSMVIKFMIDNARDLFPSEERQGTETSAS